MSHNVNSYVQNSYERILEDGLPGTLADGNPSTIDSFVAEEAIGYGVGISRGTIGPHNGNTQTGLLGVATVAATSGLLTGTGPVAELAALQAITDGQFAVSVDGTEHELASLNFSADASYAAIAANIQAVLRVATVALETVAFSADGHFVITSATTGVASIIRVDDIDDGAGTEVRELLGLGSFDADDGIAGSAATLLGITRRVMISESRGLGADSGIAETKIGEIGAVVVEGRIKVLAAATAADRADVYIDDTTGEVYFSAAGGRTQLGTSKLLGAATVNKVATINVSGLQ